MLSALMISARLVTTEVHSRLFSASTTPSTTPSPLDHDLAELRPVIRAVVACILRERPDHADVEDGTNETLRRALEAKGSAHGPIRPWVLGIARHVALDALRARQRQRARSADVGEAPGSSTTAVLDRLADPTDAVDERMALAERAAHVRTVMQKLPEGPRSALTLFHLEGLAYQQIAIRLGVPIGTVATWVTRGRKAMAEALEDDMDQAREQNPRGRTPTSSSRIP